MTSINSHRSSDSPIDRVCADTGCSADEARAIATAVLRELHYIAATDPNVTTAALVETFYNFGAEATYHLGGILMYHDDKTNDSSYDSESLVPETLARFIGSNDEGFNAARDRWFALLEQRRAEGSR